MIVWLNGTFGVGKTTTARELLPLLPGSRIFDSEYVGYLLREPMADTPVSDFQQWPLWPRLVVRTAAELLDALGGTLVVPQTVLDEKIWAELSEGLRRESVPVQHVALHADETALVRRIEGDTAETGARRWRLDHLTPYREARAWHAREARVVDTTHLAPAAVAAQIAARTPPAVGA